MLQALPVMFGAGVGEGDLLRAVRVWGDSARRVAQFQAHYFHHTIEEPFRRRGMRDNEAFEAAIVVGLRMGHSAEQMMSWLLRRHARGVPHGASVRPRGDRARGGGHPPAVAPRGARRRRSPTSPATRS